MHRTKLASVGFVAARNCMRPQVLDDAKSLLTVAARSPQRHATHPTHQTVPKTTLYYKVLLQYYSLLQSSTPVLLLYYKELPQYYSALQSTTPALLCLTKFYSSTILYYKVLLQYYSVLQRTTLPTKSKSSTTLYYKLLLQ